MTNTREIRYYVGGASDLNDMGFFEVEASTFTFEWEAEEVVADRFDDVFPPVEVGWLTFAASQIIKSLDPVAWREYLAETISEVDMSDYDDTGSED